MKKSKDQKLREMAIEYADRKAGLAIDNYEKRLREKDLEIKLLRDRVNDLQIKLGEKIDV